MWWTCPPWRFFPNSCPQQIRVLIEVKKGPECVRWGSRRGTETGRESLAYLWLSRIRAGPEPGQNRARTGPGPGILVFRRFVRNSSEMGFRPPAPLCSWASDRPNGRLAVLWKSYKPGSEVFVFSIGNDQNSWKSQNTRGDLVFRGFVQNPSEMGSRPPATLCSWASERPNARLACLWKSSKPVSEVLAFSIGNDLNS